MAAPSTPKKIFTAISMSLPPFLSVLDHGVGSAREGQPCLVANHLRLAPSATPLKHGNPFHGVADGRLDLAVLRCG